MEQPIRVEILQKFLDLKIDPAMEKSESPIEASLLRALIRVFAFDCIGDYDGGLGVFRLGVSPHLGGEVVLQQQVPVGPYRADFVLIVKQSNTAYVGAIIECDGHDFHERTKEQAQRDRSRDRWMQSGGMAVLRFTGSEIWRDAAACAKEAFETLAALCERKSSHAG